MTLKFWLVKEKMTLEQWLRRENMTTKYFSWLSSCSRTVLWKVKKKMPISSTIASRIAFLTDYQVEPLISKKKEKKT